MSNMQVFGLILGLFLYGAVVYESAESIGRKRGESAGYKSGFANGQLVGMAKEKLEKNHKAK